MNKRAMTYYALGGLILISPLKVNAASTDPIVNGIDTAATYVKEAGTAQEQIASYASDYIQGKIGQLGDINALSKAAKKVEQAKKKAEKLKEKAEAAAKEVAKKVSSVKDSINDAKDWVEDKVSDVKEGIDKAKTTVEDVKSKIDDAKAEVDKVKSEIDNVKTEIDNAKSEIDNVKNQVEEAKDSVSSLQSGAGAVVDSAIDTVQNKVSSTLDKTPFGQQSKNNTTETNNATIPEDTAWEYPTENTVGLSYNTQTSSPNTVTSSSSIPYQSQGYSYQPQGYNNISEEGYSQILNYETSAGEASQSLLPYEMGNTSTINEIRSAVQNIGTEPLPITTEDLPEAEEMDVLSSDLSPEDIQKRLQEMEDNPKSQTEQEIYTTESPVSQLTEKTKIKPIAKNPELKSEDVSKKLKDFSLSSNKSVELKTTRKIFGVNGNE